jgi:hypothetical protein
MAAAQAPGPEKRANFGPLVSMDTKEEEDAMVKEVARLHREVSELTMNLVQRAIRIGELIYKLKRRIPRPQWCKWLERRLPNLSYRTSKRYLRLYFNRHLIRGGIKTVDEAERFLAKGLKGLGEEAVEADYSRIDRDLVAPLRTVRRRLRKITYIGDDPQTIEMILESLRCEAKGLLRDLGDEFSDE